ncbi:MAG: phosphatidylserine decarboxylase family protein [Desulfomonile tiedjei]|uniref:Phosphatidylserine decarboxylase proenzyme n=1 Tax=Desulfomonile tiedjei TaxID=2358 RepID=A0A9D6V042_9BACT|nr:phosphatidylserine decarboxylase family protein [Desulfomonile tiedjei]
MICKAGHYEPIAREGYVFFVPIAVLSFVLWLFGCSWSSLGFLLISAGVAAFFRNPNRFPPEGDALVLSPADGKVVQIVEDAHSDNLPGVSLKRISIFMSVFNVHVNRWPLSGTVQRVQHFSGRFLDAREPDASKVNEHNSVVLQTQEGDIEVVQIAGLIARRIACWVSEGDRVQRGDRFGLIRFGSRLDVYLPPGFSFEVPIGARVRAGETIIAKKN